MANDDTGKIHLEDASASLLNGAMVMLLGCAVAGALAWQILAEGWGFLPDLKAMTADLPPATPTGDINFLELGLLLASLDFVWRGASYVHKNLALLRARRV